MMRQHGQSAPGTARSGATSSRRFFARIRERSPGVLFGGNTSRLTLPVSVASISFLGILAVLIQVGPTERFTRDLLNLVPPAAALAVAAIVLRGSTGRERLGRQLIAAGVICWMLGDLVYPVNSAFSDRPVPFPSVADAFYLPGYALFAAGFALIFRVRFERLDSRVLVDASAVLIGIGAMAWPYLIAPSFQADLPRFASIVAMAYPVMDLLALGVLVVAFYLSREEAPLQFLMFFFAMTIAILGDSLYAMEITVSGDYQGILDVFFAATYCLIAVGLTLSREAAATTDETRPRSGVSLRLPRVLTAAVVVLAIVDMPVAGANDAIVEVAALASIGLIAARHQLIGRENDRLLNRLQRDSNERLALLRALGDLGEGFAIIERGRVISANHALWMILGYTEKQVRAMDSFVNVVAERDRVRLQSVRQRSIESGTVVSGLEVTVVASDGREVPLELASMPLRNDGKVQILVVARDITERRQTQRVVLESQKLEGLRVLAGGVAHDFNNLLQVIRGSAALAQLEAGPDCVTTPYLNDINTASDRAAGLARQMLIYAGKADPIIATVEPTAVVEDMALLLRATLGEGIELQVSSGRFTHRVLVDASQLRQVVMNLVVNASEAIGTAGGRITVRTHNRYLYQQDLAIIHAGHELQPGLYVVIEVSDTGSGMTEEVRRRIFDPFYTTKFTGRGLGLAAVLGIVRAHGGGIAVESRPGHGATFRVFLPANLAAAEAVS